MRARLPAEVWAALDLEGDPPEILATVRGGVNDIHLLRIPKHATPLALRVRRVLSPQREVSWFAKDAICAFLTTRFACRRVDLPQLETFLSVAASGPVDFPLSAPIRYYRHASASSGSPPWSLADWLDGEELRAHPTARAYAAAGRTLRKVHTVRFASFAPAFNQPGRSLDWTAWYRGMRELFATPALGDLIGRPALDTLRRLPIAFSPKRFVLTHGDLHPANIIIDGGAARLVDWDEAGIAPPERDFANLRYRTRIDPDGRPRRDGRLYRAFLQGYMSDTAAPDGLDPYGLDHYELLFLLQQFRVTESQAPAALDIGLIRRRLRALIPRLAATTDPHAA